MNSVHTFGSFDELPKTPTKSLKKSKPHENSSNNENLQNVSINNTNHVFVTSKSNSDQMKRTNIDWMLDLEIDDCVDNKLNDGDADCDIKSYFSYAGELEKKIVDLETKYNSLLTQNIKLTEYIEALRANNDKFDQTITDNYEEISNRINIERLESILGSMFPYLSSSKAKIVSEFLVNQSRFSSKNAMKKFWNCLLVLDIMLIYVQSKCPNIFNMINSNQWKIRLIVIRYCIEMLLLVQYSIAIHEFLTNGENKKRLKMVFAKSLAYVKFKSESIIKYYYYLPTTIIFGSVFAAGFVLFKKRFSLFYNDFSYVIKNLIK